MDTKKETVTPAYPIPRSREEIAPKADTGP